MMRLAHNLIVGVGLYDPLIVLIACAALRAGR